MGANSSISAAANLSLPALSPEEQKKFISFALEHIDNEAFLNSISSVIDPTFDYPGIAALNEDLDEEEIPECNLVIYRNFAEVSYPFLQI